MTISATRTPPPTRSTGTHTCFRCGIEWRDVRLKWIAGSPCLDCRPHLIADGVDLTIYHRTDKG